MEQVAALADWEALPSAVVPAVPHSRIVVGSCCHIDMFAGNCCHIDMFADSCRHIDMAGNKQAADKHLAGNPLLAGRLNYRFRSQTCRS